MTSNIHIIVFILILAVPFIMVFVGCVIEEYNSMANKRHRRQQRSVLRKAQRRATKKGV